MEMKTNVRLVGVWRVIIISVIVSLIYACSCPDRKILYLSVKYMTKFQIY